MTLLNRDQVIEARTRVREGETAATVARAMGVSYTVIHKAAYGYTWETLNDECAPCERPITQLSLETVNSMRRNARSGASILAIAVEHNVSRSTAWNAVTGRTWRQANEPAIEDWADH